MPDPAASPVDYNLHLEVSIHASDAFEDISVTVAHPNRTIVCSAGTWQGQFSNLPDADGNPRRAVDPTDVLFAEDDSSHEHLTGIFDALTLAAVTPSEQSTGGDRGRGGSPQAIAGSGVAWPAPAARFGIRVVILPLGFVAAGPGAGR